MYKIVFIMILLSATNSYAKNYLTFFGGGYNRKSDDFFDHGLQMVSTMSPKWETKTYYRSKFLDNIPIDEKKNLKLFNQTNFDRHIAELSTKILTGKITDKDQVLILISTHGSIDPDTGKLIAAADGDEIDVSSLEKLSRIANQKGVHLGLIGSLCYSGSLIDFKGKHTCVMTSAATDRVGLIDFINLLIPNLQNLDKSVANLEDAYLKTRIQMGGTDWRPTTPKISTDIGISIDAALDPIHRIIATDDDWPKILKEPKCRDFKFQVEKLKRHIEKLKLSIADATVTERIFKHVRYKNLVANIEKIQKLYDKAHSLVPDIDSEKLIQVGFQTLNIGFIDNPNFMEFGEKNVCSNNVTAEDIIKCEDFRQRAKPINLADRMTDPSRKKRFDESPEYLKYKKQSAEYQDLINQMAQVSNDISTDEKLLYEEIYRQATAQRKLSGDKSANPCQDFRL
jgi:hypothetical protein